MSDIFVSYASADRDRARAVAQALSEQGWSDSVTPYPHAHTSRLVLRRQSDGSLRYVENCPQAGKQCYR